MYFGWLNENGYLITFSVILTYFVAALVMSSKNALNDTSKDFELFAGERRLDKSTSLKTQILYYIYRQLNATLYVIIWLLGAIAFFTGVIAFQSVF